MNNEIVDNSDDKEFFTIVPNYILNHSNAVQQALYLQMKRIAGENRSCYVSNNYFCEKMAISEPTLRKSIKYLVEHNWISFTGKKPVETAGGTQFVNCYTINNIWKLNTDHYSKGGKNNTPLNRRDDKGGKKSCPKGGKNRPANNIYNNNNIYKEHFFNLKPEDIQKLKEKFPYKDVIGEIEKAQDWCKYKGRRFKDYSAFMRNWLRKCPDTIKPTKTFVPPQVKEVSEKGLKKLKEMRDRFGL